MEKIYTDLKDRANVIEAKPGTIQFLLNYSKSLKITKAGNIQFETNLN